ncbi:MAG: ABC-type transport auxiliary lipoprotein family protein [Bdellovibrionales bacterium]
MKPFLLLVLFCLTSCALQPEPERSFYAIEPAHVLLALTALDKPQKAPLASAASRERRILRVASPRAAMGLDSERIQVQKADGSLTWVKNASWIETPTKMLEPLLMRCLETSGPFAAVVGDRSSATADLDLETSLEKFTFVEGTNASPSHVEIAIRFTLLEQQENKLISSKFVSISQPVEAVRLSSILPAFEKALARCLEQIVIRLASLDDDQNA